MAVEDGEQAEWELPHWKVNVQSSATTWNGLELTECLRRCSQSLLYPSSSLVVMAVIAGYLWDCQATTLHYQYMRTTYYWRTLIYAPLLLQGWLCSFATLQAAILTSQASLDRHTLTPRTANALYASILLILVPVVTLDCLSAPKWSNVWQAAQTISGLLARGEAAWQSTGELDGATLLQCLELLGKLELDAATFARYQLAESCMYVVSCSCIVLVNLGGVSLLLLLRRQIRSNFAQQNRQILATVSHVHLSPLPMAYLPMSPAEKLAFQQTASPSPDQTWSPVGTPANHFPSPPSSPNPLPTSRNPLTPGITAPATQTAALRKVQLDLFILIATIVSLASAFLAFAAWLASISSGSAVGMSWLDIELALYLVIWIYLPCMAVCGSVLLLNCVRHYRTGPRAQRRRADVVRVRVSPGAQNVDACVQKVDLEQSLPVLKRASSAWELAALSPRAGKGVASPRPGVLAISVVHQSHRTVEVLTEEDIVVMSGRRQSTLDKVGAAEKRLGLDAEKGGL